MFNLFKKKERIMPELKLIEASPLKDKYFARVAQWGDLEANMIFVIDPHQTRMITMDQWPQMIFMDALGQITIREYVDYVINEYGPGEDVPSDIDDTILVEIQGLLDLKIIALSDAKIDLEEKFINPIEPDNKA